MKTYILTIGSAMLAFALIMFHENTIACSVRLPYDREQQLTTRSSYFYIEKLKLKGKQGERSCSDHAIRMIRLSEIKAKEMDAARLCLSSATYNPACFANLRKNSTAHSSGSTASTSRRNTSRTWQEQAERVIPKTKDDIRFGDFEDF